MVAEPVFDLDSGNPLCTTLIAQTSPFAPNRRIEASCLCDYRLPEQSGGRESELQQPIDVHSERLHGCTVWGLNCWQTEGREREGQEEGKPQ